MKTADYFAIFTTLNIHLAVVFFTIFFYGLIYINLISFQLIYLYLFSLLCALYIVNKFKKTKIFKFIILENYLSWKNQKCFGFIHFDFSFCLIRNISNLFLNTFNISI